MEDVQPNRLLELAVASLLALTTVASAWCAYQSERWSGLQVFRLNDSDAADRHAMELSFGASQDQQHDLVVFIHYITALDQNNKALQQFYLARFRPEMRVAVDAWLATEPMSNPRAPLDPFAMPQYRLALADQAQEVRQQALRHHEAAAEAKHQSDQYVLLTVLLASVLFFGGIATHFASSQAKTAVFALAIVVFVGALFWLGTCERAP